jgi:type I restriction enzyme S subunit
MSNDWFFEKFALIADAPGAVARMRELILDLASAGKLVPEVLEKPVPDELCRLEQHVTLVMGQAPPGEQYNTNGKGTLFVKVGEFGLLYPRKEIWTTSPLKYAKLGDVLICVVGATVGKLNLAIDCAIGRSVAALRPATSMDTKFLYYSLMPYTIRLRRNSRGSAQGVIGKTELNAIELWVPTIGIQKRIVAKVDELMGICDALESQQRERESRKSVLVRASLSRFAESPTPENLGYLFHKSYDIPPSELRKSILTLAVRGKLVPQDPNDEPAVEIKKQIAKRMSAIRNQRHHTFAATEDQTDPPFSIPHNWEWMPFGTLGEFLGGGTPSKDNPAYWNGEIPWVSPKDMKRSHIKDSIDHVTPLGADASSGRLIPTGALLMVVRGMILAHTFPVAITQREVTINQDMKALRLAVPEIGEYLLRCCTALTIAMLSNVERSSHGTCRIPTEALSSFLVPIPPLAEQRRIVAKVDQLMVLVDELERQQEASREKASKLLDAIVQEMTSSG